MGSRAQRHVFLHSGWRTAGTWIWSQFRRCDGVLGFYEPFNESLGTMTLRTMPSMRPNASDSRHPEPERPYFEEFAPLLSPTRPGVLGFQSSFAYDEFFAHDDTFGQLSKYLSSLLELAESRDSIAVLKFCRSLGRIDWMRRMFPEVCHVLVLREPLSQWASGWRLFLTEGNPYFIVMPLRILAQHCDERFIAASLRGLRIRAEDCALPAKHKASCRAVRGKPRAFLYRAFLALWICATLGALSTCETIIETDRLEVPPYREEVEERLERDSGFRIDLRGARPLRQRERFLEPHEIRTAHLDALQVLDMLESQVPYGGLETAKLLRAKLYEALLPEFYEQRLV